MAMPVIPALREAEAGGPPQVVSQSKMYECMCACVCARVCSYLCVCTLKSTCMLVGGMYMRGMCMVVCSVHALVCVCPCGGWRMTHKTTVPFQQAPTSGAGMGKPLPSELCLLPLLTKVIIFFREKLRRTKTMTLSLSLSLNSLLKIFT